MLRIVIKQLMDPKYVENLKMSTNTMAFSVTLPAGDRKLMSLLDFALKQDEHIAVALVEPAIDISTHFRFKNKEKPTSYTMYYPLSEKQYGWLQSGEMSKLNKDCDSYFKIEIIANDKVDEQISKTEKSCQ